MSLTIIHNGTFKARKTYDDDGWDFINNWDGWLRNGDKLTMAEKRMLVKYRRREVPPSKILPGQLYQRQFNSYEGRTYVWRMKKDLYDFASKYDLFPEI